MLFMQRTLFTYLFTVTHLVIYSV